LRGSKLLYIYPQHHTVSFTLIARKHIEWIRKLGLAEVQELDELTLPSYIPHLKYVAVLQPYIFIYHRLIRSKYDMLSPNIRGRFQEYLSWWRSNYGGFVGIDVCDSDRLSDYAVTMLNNADRVVVPSNFCVDVYRSSGVVRPIHRLPHGVDPEWYYLPNQWDVTPVKAINPSILELYLYKVRRGRKVLLYYLWHSSWRKGWREVRELYSRLVRERRDVVLVLKTLAPNSPEFQEVMDLGAIQVYGWLSEYDKLLLYDLADITLNFSYGGGFELNCLESLARGVPCVASDWGSWTDYVPSYLRVRVGEKVQPLPNNVIHVGYGYRVDVESALDKVNDVLDKYEDYRARTEGWRAEVLSSVYRWDVIARELVGIIDSGRGKQ